EYDFPIWELKKLGDVLKIGSGRDYKHLKKGSVPVYGTGGLMTFVEDFLYDGDSIGIGRKGTIDKPFLLKGKFWTVDTLFYTHSYKKVSPKFMYYSILHLKLKKYNEASGVPSLSKKTLEKIKIDIPSIKEQSKISNFLTAIDEKIKTERQILMLYQKQKNFFLQNLFV